MSLPSFSKWLQEKRANGWKNRNPAPTHTESFTEPSGLHGLNEATEDDLLQIKGTAPTHSGLHGLNEATEDDLLQIKGTAPTHSGLYELNEATEDDLLQIKGIGPKTAQKILESLPVNSFGELKLPKNVLEKVREHFALQG